MNGYDIQNAMRRTHGFPDDKSIDDLEVLDYAGGLSRLRRFIVVLAVMMKGWT